MSTPTRTYTAADHLKLAELYVEGHDRHTQHILLASEAFYRQPCTNGEVDWRRGYGDVYDQEAETVDGYANDLGWIDWRSIRVVVLLTIGLLVAAVAR